MHAQNKSTRKTADLLTGSGPYPLSHSTKRGVSKFTSDLSEFSKNGDLLDTRRFYFSWKRSVQREILEKKFFTAIISENVQGVMGGGENPFPTHDFFHSIFLFIFTTLWSTASTGTHLFQCGTAAPYYRSHATSVAQSRQILHDDPVPTPYLPHDSDHAECGGDLCLHGSTTRFSLFCFGSSGPLAETLGPIIVEVPLRIFF